MSPRLQMRLATEVREVATALLELEGCVRRVALSAQWQQPVSTTDGLLHIPPPPSQHRAGHSTPGRPKSHHKAKPVPSDAGTPAAAPIGRSVSTDNLSAPQIPAVPC